MPPLIVQCSHCEQPGYRTTDNFYRWPSGRWSRRCRNCSALARARTRVRASRLFGVEIEFLGDSWTVAQEMTALGVPTSVDRFNWDEDGRLAQWDIRADGSLNYDFPEECGELVSPPLPLTQAERTIYIAGQAFRGADAEADHSCGLHVHQDARDLELGHFGRLFRFYYTHQQLFNRLFPTRVNNGYSRQLNDYTVQAVENMRSLSDINSWRINTGRGVLHASCYPRDGSVEFRQHHGTTDPDEIFSWVATTSAIMEWCKTDDPIRPHRDLLSMFAQLREHGLTEGAAALMRQRNAVHA